MQNETKPSKPVLLENDDPKRILELKKLALEIAEIERPWWKRPSYILAALPTLLATVALSIGFLNGFFGVQLTNLQIQTTRLEMQKHDLEVLIKAFEEKRDELHKQNEALAKENQDLTREKSELSNNLEATNKRVDALMTLVRPQITRRDVFRVLEPRYVMRETR